MHLTLNRPYMSLVDLPQTELPPFTLITGKNGAGKTHLLKALQTGAAVADIAPDTGMDIRLFDWTNLAPAEEGDFDASTLRQEQLNLYNQVNNLLKQHSWGFPQLYNVVRNYIPGDLANDASWLASASLNDIERARKQGSPDANIIKNAIDHVFIEMEKNLRPYIIPTQFAVLKEISARRAKPIGAITYDELLKSGKPIWGEANLFQQSFSRLFVAYREIYQMNGLARLAEAEGESGVLSLNPAEFEKNHGPAPWNFVNDSLQAASLDFTIDAPSLFEFAAYRPRLHKKGINAEIQFSALSSGERILMALAFAVYYASDSRQSIVRPKLLLLDEIDAPLHPSMCKNLLSTIQHVLVGQESLAVIMTTHSPTTVALADENSIFVMKAGLPGIHKATKDAALKDLTDGVPTLSISYDGRRQVFVESPRDVDVYQAVYDATKSFIKSSITLNFIATGVETSAGTHVNTGCSVVERIVDQLRGAGARHTVGLLDWDGRNRSRDGIFVLAEGERNGLESMMFDPLLLLNTIIRHIGVRAIKIDWPNNSSYLNLTDLDHKILQEAIDALQEKVLSRTLSTRCRISYLGGFDLDVDEDYITMDDHKLEHLIMTSFPELNAISKNRAG